MIAPIESFEQAPSAIFYWFKNTLLKSNAIKCNTLVSTNNCIGIKVGGFEKVNS